MECLFEYIQQEESFIPATNCLIDLLSFSVLFSLLYSIFFILIYFLIKK